MNSLRQEKLCFDECNGSNKASTYDPGVGLRYQF
jgi:hypothetical protein